jgi:hypothetical protein
MKSMCSLIVAQSFTALHGGCVAVLVFKHCVASRFARACPTVFEQLSTACACICACACPTGTAASANNDVNPKEKVRMLPPYVLRGRADIAQTCVGERRSTRAAV